MADLLLDIHLEVDPAALAGERRPDQAVAELSRTEAERQCTERGARLRHSAPAEVLVSNALSPTTGDDVLLVASRWVVDGP
jgi:hypothetical protein